MPWYREGRDFFSGSLTSTASAAATSLVAAEFAALPTVYTTDRVLPITLYSPLTNAYEIAWIVGHSAASTTVTVQRAKEATSAAIWNAGTPVVSAPTIRDVGIATTRALLPSDAHGGQKAMLTDEGFSVEKTIDQGWQASVGAAPPGDFGRRFGGAAIPSTKAILQRSDHHTINTDANGRVTVTYKSPFPAETISALANCGEAIITPYSSTASTCTFQCINAVSGAAAGSGLPINVWYVAFGY